jgi:membrane-associated phospholipid phosphatase
MLTGLFAPLDRPVQRAFQDRELQDNRVLHRTADGFSLMGGPGPFIIGPALFLGGGLARYAPMQDVGAHLMEGVLLAASIDGLLKGFTGRTLPDAGSGRPSDFSFGRGFHDNNGPFVSFPSGHTAAGFAMAAVLVEETARRDPGASRYVTPIAYGGATLIALSRLYENVHWASDLPLGAAIGIWSGMTVVKWQHRGTHGAMARLLAHASLAPAPGARRGVALAWSTTGALSGH